MCVRQVERGSVSPAQCSGRLASGFCRPESSTTTQVRRIPRPLQPLPSPQRLQGCSLSQPVQAQAPGRRGGGADPLPLGSYWVLSGHSLQFSSAQSLSRVRLCDPVDCSTPGLPVHHQLLEFAQTHVIESVMPSNHLILCRPLLLPSTLPSFRVFSNESALHIRWPKYWSFSFSISPSNEHPGLIFRMDWLDLLVVHGTLKSLLQHHSAKASIL